MDLPAYLGPGSWRIDPHLLFETLAYLIGFRIYWRLRKRFGDPLSEGARWSVVAAAAVGAAVGSKLFYWLEDPWATLRQWSDPTYLMAGKTIVGGLIGGLIAVEWVKRRIGVRQSTGDLFALPLALGIAVGRIGCFLAGLADHTYGTPTRLPWGVNFGDGVARHPTQLYEIAFLLLLSVALWQRMREPHRNGDVFKLFMVGYMVWRLLVDFLKPEVRLAGLGALQWGCVAVLVYYGRDLRHLFAGKPRPHAAGT
jgi:prolipoprotein diacylglyceryltransferase